jgi:hypothetical protein
VLVYILGFDLGVVDEEASKGWRNVGYLWGIPYLSLERLDCRHLILDLERS